MRRVLSIVQGIITYLGLHLAGLDVDDIGFGRCLGLLVCICVVLGISEIMAQLDKE